VIETVLERDRFLANGHGNVRLLVSVAWYVYGFVGFVHLAGRERTEELGAMDLAHPLCCDTTRIPRDWSDFDRGDFARCAVLPHIGRIVLDLQR
jgi:hypothetical protein